MSLTLRNAMCEALVDGWVGNWTMGKVVAHAWILVGNEPDDLIERYKLATAAVKASWLKPGESAKTWIPRNFAKLNDALWAGRKRDDCILIVRKSLGYTGGGSVKLRIKARDLTKGSDWKTVK